MKKNITLVSLMLGVMLLVSVTGFVSAVQNGASVSYETEECGETTFTANKIGDHGVSNMYLIVDVDGDVSYVNIPVNGNDVTLTVGPFFGTTSETIRWRVFGGGERDFDQPLWDGYGGPDFTSNIVDYNDEYGDEEWSWTLSGYDDTNPFTNWNDFQVSGCCSDCELDVTHPLEDEFYCENPLWINWTAEGDDCLFYTVQYGTWDGEECEFSAQTLLAHDITDLQFPWDTSEIIDGNYCVKVTGDCCEDAVEGPFCIDCTEPEVSVCVQGNCPSCSEGIENDTFNDDSATFIDVTYSDPDYNCEQTCVLQCEIDWGDGQTTNCTGQDPEAVEEYTHQYGDDGDYDITVTVTDCADNEGTDEYTATVENVPPTCDIEVLSDDLVVGLPIEFKGNAYDVDADLTKMIYEWNFQDGNMSDEKMPTNIFTSPGVYNVALKVYDTDGGMGDCYKEIEVVAPTPISNQEVAAFYPLEADFGQETPHPAQFNHGLEGFGTCSIIDGPNNLVIGSDAGTKCGIHWDKYDPFGYPTANPTNDQRGTHNVLIKINNGTDVEYYSFDVTVWSWIIDLEAGWNLISIPLVPENGNSLTDVLGGIKDNITGGSSGFSVYQYDGIADEWVYTRPTSISWSTADGADLESINPGYGYWIHMDNADTLKGMGVKQLGIDPRPSVDVSTKNWNLIGRYGIVGYEFGVHGAIDRDLALSNVHKEDNSLHTFGESGSSVSEIENNEGYWMLVEEDYTTDSVSELYTPLDEGEWVWFIDYYDRN